MSIETVKLVNELAQAVTVEDWLGEAVEIKAQKVKSDNEAIRPELFEMDG